MSVCSIIVVLQPKKEEIIISKNYMNNDKIIYVLHSIEKKNIYRQKYNILLWASISLK